MQTLAKAGELTLKLPTCAKVDKSGRRGAIGPKKKALAQSASETDVARPAPSRALAVVARNDPKAADFIARFARKNCKGHVSEEWKQVDDRKLDQMRAILAATEEEAPNHQLLKKRITERQAGFSLKATRESSQRRLQDCRLQEEIFEEKEADFKRRVLKHANSLRLIESNIEKCEREHFQVERKAMSNKIRVAPKDPQEQEEEQQIKRAFERALKPSATHRDMSEDGIS